MEGRAGATVAGIFETRGETAFRELEEDAALETLTAYLTGLGFVAVEVDPRGYRRGSLLAECAPPGRA